MKSFTCEQQTTKNCRTEIFSKNNVIVFNDHYESLQIARQLAAIKNIQADRRPFYVMDVGRVNELFDKWHNYLPRVQPFYAVNCNDDNVLLKILANNSNIGFYCQTKQNVKKALELITSDRLLYGNPLWTRSNILQAQEDGVSLLSFDNARDLSRLITLYPNARLILNVSVNSDSEDISAQFGCTFENAFEILQTAADLKAQCVGLAFNIGSSCRSAIFYERAIEKISQLFNFASKIGLYINFLNIGGGFTNQKNYNVGFDMICKQINASLDYYFPIEKFPDLQIIATPGRFFAESVFLLVTNVVRRQSVDASYVTNNEFDLGTEAFIYETNEGYYGSFGCSININCSPQCTPLFDNYLDHFSSEHVYGSVLGPTQDKNFDVLQSLCRFRPLNVGEWLLWNNMGAYSLNNCNNLNEDDDNLISEHSPTPKIFYFSSQNNWKRVQNQFYVKSEAEFNNKNQKSKLLETDYLFFDDDEGICRNEEQRRSISPSEKSDSTFNNDYLEEEDFLIGLDNDFLEHNINYSTFPYQ